MPRNEPQRSCLSCRTVKEKKDLLRFVLAPDRTLVPDLQAKLPGRGAYTCPKKSCLREAAAKKQFARSFRGEVRSGTPDELVSLVAARMEERIAAYLALANKAGKVASGGDTVAELLTRRTPGIICIAADISPDIGEKVAYQAARAGVEYFTLFDKERLGALLGKALRSVVAVERGGFSETIRKELERYRNFFEGGTDAT
ncbi:MAG: DUF448 domain-containing protein [Geobacteraceae bacterium]|nr:DUF448 domain-containing protein [Geobacteraceae bacterium]